MLDSSCHCKIYSEKFSSYSEGESYCRNCPYNKEYCRGLAYGPGGYYD